MTFGTAAWADELVKFASASRGDPVQGYLTRPKGAGPFPAVVLLHTCLGLPEGRAAASASGSRAGVMSRCSSTTSPTRGLKDTCAVDFPQGVADAFGAIAFLSGQPLVDKDARRRRRLFARG